ncbi:MAG: VPLPA-CTERM sorting domain-containing protein [Paracoccaceae bacterium]
MKNTLAILFALALGTTANAATVSFGPASAGGSGPVVTFSDLVVPTAISGDAILTFTVNGDLNSSREYIDVSFDGISLGRVLNNNTTDDAFDFGNGDVGNQSRSDLTGSATISQSDYETVAADGLITLTFDTAANVDCCGTINTLLGSLTFASAPVPAVPLPASSLLLLGGLAGFGALRASKKS